MKPINNRNLYNGDCTFLFGQGYQVHPGEPYTAEVMHNFIDLIADNGIDTYLCNTNAQVPWFPSKAVPNILTGYTRGDREFFRGHFPPPNDTDFPPEMLEQRIDEQVVFLNRYLDLADAGVDWVEEIIKACRRRGVSPWASVRMNDMHGANSWEKSYMNCELQRDPRYRLSGREINPRDGINRMMTPLNYEHREVRDYYFTQIRELVEDYDFEGLELDWLRCPLCCEPTASRSTLDMMTAWIADIRALTEARTRATGKPFPLGLRVPVRLGILRMHGLDVVRLAREGLIDFIGPSNFWQTTWDVPYEQLRKTLGDAVAIYGVMEDAPNWLDAYHPESQRRGYRLLTASPQLIRGNAASKLAAGVDGLEQFNFFCTDEEGIHAAASKCQARYDELKDLPNLERLRGQSKHYALASMSGAFQFPFYEYAEQIPAILEPDWRRAFRLTMCAEPNERELTIQIVVEKQESVPELGVSFNGSWPSFEATTTDELLYPTGVYTHHVPENQALNFRFSSSLILEGWNELVVFNGAHDRSTPAIKIVSVELGVR